MNWNIWPTFDSIPEGPMAHDITSEKLRQQIKDAYEKKYRPPMTPYTHPEKYDPFDPPEGWMYDPYYEMWIER